MTSPCPGVNRIKADVLKLIESQYEVAVSNNLNEFVVKFNGPPNTPYAGGVWRVRVDLPDKYPFKSPSIGFTNRIFHPNIDEISGTVCLDVINQTWSPMYDLKNVFDTFLPQLLAYPNPSDPLNGDAAALFIHRPDEFKQTVKEYVKKYASDESTTIESAPQTGSSSIGQLLFSGDADSGEQAIEATEIECSVSQAVNVVSTTVQATDEGSYAAGSISDDDVFVDNMLDAFPSPPPVTIDLMSPQPVRGETRAAASRNSSSQRVLRPTRGDRARTLDRLLSRQQSMLQRRLSSDAAGSQWPQPIGGNEGRQSSRRWTIVLDDGEEEITAENNQDDTKKRRRCVTLPCTIENVSDESEMSDFDDCRI